MKGKPENKLIPFFIILIISGRQSCFTWPSVNDPTVTTTS